MELIKQIKDAENQAKEMVEKARKDAVVKTEQERLAYEQQLRAAQKERQQVIDNAIAQAEKDTQRQVAELIEQGRKQIEAVRAACQGRVDACAAKVVAKLEQIG